MNYTLSSYFRFSMTLCLLPFSLDCVCHNAAAAESFKFLAPKGGEAIEQYLTQAEANGFCGIALVVARGNHLVHRPLGLAASGKSNSVETAFYAGTLAKPVTSAAIFALSIDGAVYPPHTVGKFFPHAPNDKQNITVLQMLTHTSGITSAQNAESLDADWLKGAFQRPLAFVPGEKVSISAADYAILATIIEKLSSKTLPAFVEGKLFDAAGAENIWFIGSQPKTDVAMAFRGNEEGKPLQILAKNKPGPEVYGDSGIFTTAEDYQKFCYKVLGSGWLHESSFQTMLRPVKEDLACGWNVNSFGNGVRLTQKQPRTEEGISAMVQVTTAPETYTVVLSNGYIKQNAPAAEEVVTEITKRLFK